MGTMVFALPCGKCPGLYLVPARAPESGNVAHQLTRHLPQTNNAGRLASLLYIALLGNGNRVTDAKPARRIIHLFTPSRTKYPIFC